MKKLHIFIVLFLFSMTTFGQEIIINQQSDSIALKTSKSYDLAFKKGEIYRFYFGKPTISFEIKLSLNGKVIKNYSHYPDNNSFILFDIISTETANYQLVINRIKESWNREKGKFVVKISQFDAQQKVEKLKIIKELETENKKNVQTLDIIHFYEAFDNLKNCKTKQDSIDSFQKLYLDRATDGLSDFINKRFFTATEYARLAGKFPKFYDSLRKNLTAVNEASPTVEKIISNFSKIYKNYHPVKVCFAIGITNTGGTISDDFMLIGSEITTSNNDVDLSEFPKGSWESGVLQDTSKNILQKISSMVAHEYVHTQQNWKNSPNAIDCILLGQSLREGMCDFVGEKISGGNQINMGKHIYGNAHEKELWENFKAELCDSKTKNWMYNSDVKDKPSDLGYYIGYKIVEEYYKNVTDKTQAISDILEMNDPISFLQKSKYDQKIKR